ncbi:MAG: ParB family transcriptional regulator, chromosome partitioning protein [Clostridia bacterium]|jgi:ParB family chromosome partitioning protein|nr:ParB family transcriptional regulator, chromosome partitioning protein [Clostridia bacterium]
MSKRGLGKGLGALIPTTNPVQYDPDKDTISELNIHEILPNSFQPRKNFDPDKLSELAASIKEHGVIQPVIVRPHSEGYELVVGERRLRACKQLGLEKIPAVIRALSDRDMTEMALIENIQRHDLNPIEEAKAYKKLIEEFGLTQEEVAKKVGKSRPFIANYLRILHLPELIHDYLAKGVLTVGHARPLLSIENQSLQLQLVKQIIDNGLSVRETENLIKKSLKKSAVKNKTGKASTLSPILNDIQDRLRNRFSTKVNIKDDGKKGKIEIEYYNHDDLQRILELIDI